MVWKVTVGPHESSGHPGPSIRVVMQICCCYCLVGAVRPAAIKHVGAGKVCRHNGRPAVGHTHGTTLWYTVGWWDATSQYSHPAGWWIHLPLGHWQV